MVECSCSGLALGDLYGNGYKDVVYVAGNYLYGINGCNGSLDFSYNIGQTSAMTPVLTKS